MSLNVHTHYGQAMNPAELVRFGLRGADWLMNNPHKYEGAPLLVYTGMSGVAASTAITLELTRNYPDLLFGQLYIRKDNESSHSINARGDYDSDGECRMGGYELSLKTSIVPDYGSDYEFPDWKDAITGTCPGVPTIYYPVFVDDFTSYGHTFNRCCNFLRWPIEHWCALLNKVAVPRGDIQRGVYDDPNSSVQLHNYTANLWGD